MALHDDISDAVIEDCISSFERNAFTTLTIVEYLVKNQPNLIEDLKGWSPRNWRSVVGKAIKRYSVHTNKIRQVSPANESPARWKKVQL
jgi:hypothetical protein